MIREQYYHSLMEGALSLVVHVAVVIGKSPGQEKFGTYVAEVSQP